MKVCFGLFAVAVLSLGLIAVEANAEEYSTLVEWADANGIGGGVDTPPITTFGQLLGSWSPNVYNVIGVAFDLGAHGLWVANEEGYGNLYLVDVNAPHSHLRTISVVGFGITYDGNSDGVALDMANNRILLSDYQGDLTNMDDVIYEINYGSGSLTNYWPLDGSWNTNPNAHINMVLGVCVDGDGGVWASDNEARLHSINLMANNQWSQNFQQTVPGGGSWAELDFDPCLGEFFVANFSLQGVQYHDLLTNPPLQQFTGMSTTTAVSSNENGLLYVSGFGDNQVYEHEGIECGGVATEETSWGALKTLYR